jgi:hypothetical protein
MEKTKATADLIFDHQFITSSCVLPFFGILSGRCFVRQSLTYETSESGKDD